MSFTAIKKFPFDTIKLRFLPNKDEVLQVTDLEDKELWSQNLTEKKAAFRFVPGANLFQIGNLEGDDGSIFKRSMEDTDRKAQMTFFFSEEEAAVSSTFIGIADLRDGRYAHFFNLGLAALEISSVIEAGVRYWVLRAPLKDGRDKPLGYSYGELTPKL